jgi:hypothetical protein
MKMCNLDKEVLVQKRLVHFFTLWVNSYVADVALVHCVVTFLSMLVYSIYGVFVALNLF